MKLLYRYRHPIIACILLFALGFIFFSSTGRDDAHITYWASHALAHFGKIINYNGEKVEQSSSLLHVLLLAAVAKVSGANIASIGPALSILFGMLIIFSVHKFTKLLHNTLSPYTTFLTATSTPIVYWSFGGLEATMVAFLVVIFLLAYIKFFKNKPNSLSYFLLLLINLSYLMVRPESIFIILLFLLLITAFSIFSIALKKNSEYWIKILKKSILLFIINIFLFSLLFTFRSIYFGSPFPQPVIAKMGTLKVYQGIVYIIMTCRDMLSIMVLVFIFIVAYIMHINNGKQNDYFNSNILLFFIISYLSFVITAGGDWMEGGRFLVPIIPLTIILTVYYLYELFSIKGKIVYLKMITTFIFSLQICCILLFSYKNGANASTGRPYWTKGRLYKNIQSINLNEFSYFDIMGREHLREIPLIEYMENIIKNILLHKDDKVTIMSIQAGMIPYYIAKNFFGKIRFIDLQGLTTRDFTICNISKDLPKTSFGIKMNYAYYFAHKEKFKDECGIPIPDIIFELDGLHREIIELLKNFGYTIVYRQIGDIKTHSIFKGNTIPSNQLIAVRNDLLDYYGEETKIWQWNF